jgi:hypothetical protein
MSGQHDVELQQLVDEHKHLQTLIDEQRAWWQEVREIGIPRFGEMASRLSVLRHRLSEHFSHEESAEHDFIKAALLVFSREEAAKLAEDHSNLLQRLDKIISKANACGGYECWGEVGLEFSELIHAIDEHEGEELQRLGETLRERSLAASG